MYWRLNRVMYPVYNLGSGKRLAIWVQGCSRHCGGCISRDLWPEEGGRKVDIAEFVGVIKNMAGALDGITITGGEPFEQYNQLVAFSTFIRKETGLEILVFTGYHLRDLLEKFPDRLFLNCMDYLVDGPYRRDLHDGERLRGSANQQFYKFHRQSPQGGSVQVEKLDALKVKERWSLQVDKKNTVFMSGIPNRGFAKSVTDGMQKAGIDFEIG